MGWGDGEDEGPSKDLDRKGEGTSGLFFIFIKIIKKKSPSLGPGAAVGVGAEVDSWDILRRR